MDIILLGKCQEVWVFGSQMTEGMKREVENCLTTITLIYNDNNKGIASIRKSINLISNCFELQIIYKNVNNGISKNVKDVIKIII